MSRHEGVSCASCSKKDFTGRRFKCLLCIDYDLCAVCYESSSITRDHKAEHPMQCILTRSDFAIYYSGESLSADIPQSLTCPYCGRMGFTQSLLLEHISCEHFEIGRVLCPICAFKCGSERNHKINDLSSHLMVEHNVSFPPFNMFGMDPITEPNLLEIFRHEELLTARNEEESSVSVLEMDAEPEVLEEHSNMEAEEDFEAFTRRFTEFVRITNNAPSPTDNNPQTAFGNINMVVNEEVEIEEQSECMNKNDFEEKIESEFDSEDGSDNAVGGVPNIADRDKFLLNRYFKTTKPEDTMSEEELQVLEQERANRSLFVQELFMSVLSTIDNTNMEVCVSDFFRTSL